MSQQKNSITCTCCQKLFDGYILARYCSDICRDATRKDALLSKYLKKSIIKFDDNSNPDSYVVCGVCGYRSSDLAGHPKMHGLSQKEYRTTYGDIKCKNLCDNMSGPNNPGYQHGGKLSPFSKKFVKFISGDYIKELQKKAVHSMNTNNTNQMRLSYYTSQGYTEEEAQLSLSKRQRTFSLDICIEKHGVEEGTRVWSARQEKWLKTLDSKTDEEKAAINKKKLPKIGMSSKQEKLLANLIKSTGIDIETQFVIRRTDDSKRYYAYDIMYNNRIIEYNGDLWHANPSVYKEEDVPRFPSNTKPAKEIWERDRKKLLLAEQNDYEVHVVWESQFKKDKQRVVAECIHYLTQ